MIPDLTLSEESVDSLVERAQGGAADAFEALYERFYDRIFRYLSFKTGDPAVAEDIAVEVFLRMLTSIGSYRPQGHPFSSWLFRIAHNLAVDHFRKHGRRPTVSLDSVTGVVGETASDIDNQVQTNLAMSEVEKAMDCLTDLQRQVISMRFAGELSVRETAEALGRKENAIKALQHAGIKKLRRTLDPAVNPYHLHA